MFGVNLNMNVSARKSRRLRKPLAPSGSTNRVEETPVKSKEDLNSSFMSIDDEEDEPMSIRKAKRKSLGKENNISSFMKSAKKPKSSNVKMKKRTPGSTRNTSLHRAKRRRVHTGTPNSLESSLLDEDDLRSNRHTTPAAAKPSVVKSKTPRTARKRKSISATAGLEAGLEAKHALAKQYKDQGNKYYSEQDYERAVQAYTRAIELQPSCAVYLSNRAAARLMQNEFREAAGDCEAAIALNPNFARAHLRAARAYLAIGKVASARQHLFTIKEEREQESIELLQRCSLYEQLIERGDRFLGEENLQKCAVVAEQAEEIAPGSRRVYLLKHTAELVYAATCGKSETRGRTIIVGIKAQINQIVSEAKAAQQDVDDFAKDLYHYGKVLLYCALTTEARLLFSFAAKLHPNDQRIVQRINLVNQMEAHLNGGSQAFAKNDFPAAITSFNAALALDSSNAAFNGRMHFRLAAAYMSLKNYQSSIDHCTESLKYLPGYHKARIRRAHAYMKLGSFEKAIAELEDTYKVDPTPAVAKELKTAKVAHERELRKMQEEQQAKQKMHQEREWQQQSQRTQAHQSFKEQKKSHNKTPDRKKRNSLDAILSGDHYQVLGVSRKASSKSIKKAFRTKALRYHPDKSRSPNASVKFKRVNEAYNVLKSPEKKRSYDRASSFNFYY